MSSGVNSHLNLNLWRALCLSSSPFTRGKSYKSVIFGARRPNRGPLVLSTCSYPNNLA